MTYSGLFVRDHLGQAPDNNNNPGDWNNSPDMIFAVGGNPPKPQPPADTSVYTTPTGYNTDFGSTVFMQQTNYVYLRALNTTSGPVTGAAWFYYAESDLALWPAKWRTDNILVDGVSTNTQQIQIPQAGGVGVTDAFLWTPPPFHQGASSWDHYCCLVWMENPPLQPPPWTPLSAIPNMNSWGDLANFVVNNPNVGWRNTQDVSGTSNWQRTSSITGPPQGGTIQVGMACNNMPTDGQFSYTIPAAGGMPSHTFPTTTIWDPNATVITSINFPAAAATSLTITYQQGATTPPPGSSISAVVVLPNAQMEDHLWRRAQEVAPWRCVQAPSVSKEGVLVADNISGVIFGANPYQF